MPEPKAGCCTPDPKLTGQGNGRDLQPIVPTQAELDYGFIPLPAATFIMGANDGPHPEDGEGPAREVTLDGYALAPLTVTNAQFFRFVDATGYTTLAEREGASFVFHLLVPGLTADCPIVAQATWWHSVAGACWRTPEGPDGQDFEALYDHPVTHIALEDALAYCHWSRTRLPTEAEWEHAARGGLDQKPFPWGDDLEPEGKHLSNVWQGDFPSQNSAADGYVGTAPAQCYAANAYGFYAMTGNVWEWTADRFTALHSPRPVKNPIGPLNGDRMVAKGGSYLCHVSYCTRYRTSSRQALDPQTTAGNLGFRVAASFA